MAVVIYEAFSKKYIFTTPETIIKHKNKQCGNCGYENSHICFKNMLCNDKRIKNKDLFASNEFHTLCKKCIKDFIIVRKKMLKTTMRPSALNNVPTKIFGIAYTHGDHTFDIRDINCLVGTYWYDPEAFRYECLEIIKRNN